ncbi:MAG: LysM peptidoglycan-binding domain-containing protein [Lachnospiraceae bacterium]|nr:LysM peptidoglycan-binding domain-containing protein [Lachnospiraceae bacterium]
MARIIPIPIGPIFPGGPCRGIIHVIQKGDTLYQLGKRYHVSVGQLMFANPFVDVYNLQIGDELCIPATIQPRAVGAEERRQYQDMGGWDDRNGREDWDGRSGQEDWNDAADGQDWNDRNGREDWDDAADGEDWDGRSGREDWDDGDRQDWDSRSGRESWDDGRMNL